MTKTRFPFTTPWRAAALALLSPGLAGAADGLLAYDGFDYAAGSTLHGQAGGSGWTSAWSYTAGAAASGSIVEGLAYRDAAGVALRTEGGAWATDPGVFFAQAQRDTAAGFGAAGTSTWMSFLVRQTSLPTSGMSYAMGTPGMGYTFGSNAMAGGLSGDAAAVTPFYTTSGEVRLPGAVAAERTALIVLRLDFAASGNDTMSLWLDPLLGADPGAADLSIALRDYAPSFSGVTLAHGDFRVFAFDELRIGSSFAAVTPAVPEPSSWLLLAAGLAAVGLRGRARAPRAR